MSYGAVLRAWSKEDGPLRITQSSYGFEIMEEFRPEVHKEHREAMRKKKFNDKLDGRVYLEGVIEWHVHKVSASKITCLIEAKLQSFDANAHHLIGRSCSNTQRVLIKHGIPKFRLHKKTLHLR